MRFLKFAVKLTNIYLENAAVSNELKVILIFKKDLTSIYN